MTENNTGMLMNGIFTTSRRDLQNEANAITPNALKQALIDLENQGKQLPVLWEHGRSKEFGSRIIGYVQVFFYTPLEYNLDSPIPLNMEIRGILNITDPRAQELIKQGVRGLSLNWKYDKNSVLIQPTTGQELHRKITLIEVSVTTTPVNQDCVANIIDQNEIAHRFANKSIYLNGEAVKIKALYNLGEDEYVDIEYLDDCLCVKSLDSVFLPNLTIKNNYMFSELYNKVVAQIGDKVSTEGLEICFTGPTNGYIENDGIKIPFEIGEDDTIIISEVVVPEAPEVETQVMDEEVKPEKMEETKSVDIEEKTMPVEEVKPIAEEEKTIETKTPTVKEESDTDMVEEFKSLEEKAPQTTVSEIVNNAEAVNADTSAAKIDETKVKAFKAKPNYGVIANHFFKHLIK